MKPRDISIRTVLNGWIAKVGCQTLVFTDLKVLLKDLEGYLEQPEVMEKHYQENCVNSEFFNFAEEVVATEESNLDRIERRLDEMRYAIQET